MTKWRCDECDPSCNLEVHEGNVAPPSGCPFNVPPVEWYVVTATRKTAKTKRKKSTVKKVEPDAAAKARSLLF